MWIAPVELTFESLGPKDVAKSMLKFWKYQFEQARTVYVSDKASYSGGLRANEEAEVEWKQDDNMSFFGPPKPFSDADLERIQKRIVVSEAKYKEAYAALDYFLTYIFDNMEHKAVDTDEE